MNLTQLLMTPNEGLNRFLTFFLFWPESLLYELFFKRIFNIKISKIQQLVYIITLPTVATFSVHFLPNPFSYLVNLSTLFIILKFLFKQTYSKSLLELTVIYTAIFVASTTSSILVTNIFKISYKTISNVAIYHIIISVTTYTILFAIYTLITNRAKILTKLKDRSKYFNYFIKFNIILGIIVIFVNSYIFYTQKTLIPYIAELFVLVPIIFYIIISISCLSTNKQLEHTSQELKCEKLYNKTLSLLHDNIRCFKHDFNNIVQAIGGYIDLNDMDGLKKYYKNLLADCKQTNNLNVLNPNTINNPSLYSLFTNKYFLALDNHISINFDVFADLTELNCNIYELSRILGILLDNAIEAAKETKEKQVLISIKSNSKKIIITIENSCPDTHVPLDKIFEKGCSSKIHNTGLGLWKVHKMLEQNTQFDLYTTIHDNKFSQMLTIYN